MKKYFFFDIDQTILAGPPGNQYAPESAKIALKKLAENGHFLSIATSRGQAMAVDVMREFGIKNMVSDGGNGITIDNKLIGIRSLDMEKCAALIRECEERGLAWGLTPDNNNIRLVPDGRFQQETNDFWLKSVIVEDLKIENYTRMYKMCIACSEEEEKKLLTLRALPYSRYTSEYIMIEPVSKGDGICRMMEMVGGDLRDVVVFGDGHNDLDMFRPEWTTVAMGNAVDELKAAATFVTKKDVDDGVYYACKHFGWI